MNKYLLNALFVFSFLGILLVTMFSFMLWPWGDDMIVRHDLQRMSLIDYTIENGINWDARILTPIGFIQNFFFKYIPHNLLILNYVIIFFASTYLIYKYIIKVEIKDCKMNFIFYVFFSLLLFYGLNKAVGEVIYWGSGALYILNLFAGLLWIVFHDHVLTVQDNNKPILVGFLLLSIFAGTLTYNLSLALLGYGFLFLFMEKPMLKIRVVGLFLMLLGFFALVLSPGAFKRVNGCGVLDEYAIKSYVFNLLYAFVEVPQKYFSFGCIAFLLIFLFTLTLKIYLPQKMGCQVVGDDLKSFLKFIVFAVIAILTIVPFLIAHQLAVPRTSIYFTFFLTIFFFHFYSWFFESVFAWSVGCENLAGMIILVFFICHCFLFSRHFYVVNDLKIQYKIRDKYLIEQASSGQKFVEITPYNFKDDVFSLSMLKQSEPTKDTRNYKNVFYQKYYGIDSVVIK